jgi:hypothetical protein
MSQALCSTSRAAGNITHAPFTYQRQGRSIVAALVVIAIWLTLITAYFYLEASPWVLAVLTLFTLPAAVDFARNPESGLTLDQNTLAWHTGARTGEVTFDEIDRVRMDTRLDMSVRVSVILTTGRKIRLPFESTPPHLEFEAALKARDIPTERFHFQLMQ